MNYNMESYPAINDLQRLSSGTSKSPDPDFIVVFRDSQNKIEVDVTKAMTHFFNSIGTRYNYNKSYQKYCITAINNLIKKNEFLQLKLQVSEKILDQEEFDKELQENEEKYLIKLIPLECQDDIFVINDIVKNINGELDVDEVGELFSIDPDSFMKPLHRQ
jgi:hypothetical protein